jgi:hypothetical protein
VASVVAFTFANKFTLQGPLAAQKFRARDKDKDLKILKTLELTTGTSNPVFSFRRRESSSPGGVIA